jgi:hypothetical protein
VTENGGDQKPGDHKKHVHADESTINPSGKGVIGDHREYGDSAKTIDIGSIFWAKKAERRSGISTRAGGIARRPLWN